MSYPATLHLIGKESDKKKAPPEKNPAAVPLGRLGRLKDGKARMKQLSAKRRTEIARTPARPVGKTPNYPRNPARPMNRGAADVPFVPLRCGRSRRQCRRGSGGRDVVEVALMSARSARSGRPDPRPFRGRSLYVDVLAGFCLLGFRGTAARAFMTRLGGFLTRCFCFRFAFGFVMPPSCTVFLGVRFLTVSFLA